jgi:ubiquinone/menaquinone biosynthesis C-methylase UbiE
MTGADAVKQCCARAYESDFARLLLGESFHPGGVRLTERLGVLLDITPKSLVLDVASGNGASAFYIAERFGCRVLGIDYSATSVQAANTAAQSRGFAERVRFQQGDAERLPVEDTAFDAIICECAFCTFPDKNSAAREFARALRAGGGIGLSDLTRGPALPEDLNGLLAWVACIADAQTLESYADSLRRAGLRVDHTEPHDEALVEMVNQVRVRLLGAEIAVGLKKIDLPGVDFASAKRMAQAALQAIASGSLGYAVLHATKA